MIFSTGPNWHEFPQSMPLSSDKQCVCPICGFRTLYKTNLTRHMANHSEAKPHKCEYCLKTFRRKDYLKQHILYHKDVTHPLYQPEAIWTANIGSSEYMYFVPLFQKSYVVEFYDFVHVNVYEVIINWW